MTFTIPGYRVEQLLGYGSQAQVWAAEALDTGERVAIKRISVGSPAAARAARAEAALLATLDHPSLIGMRAYIAVDAEVALVMELAAAGSLAELLQRRGRLSAAEVVATISPIAAALAHAHAQGVLHADVSAANILFTAAGQPKLADLGVSRLLAERATAIGTPAYVDPAVAAGGAPGAASDVFSLGAVALHALTGTGPWVVPGGAPATAEQALATAATGIIADLDRRLAETGPELAQVLRRTLDPLPHRRGTAAEFALDLRASLRPVPVMLAGGRIHTKLGRHSIQLQQANAAAGQRAPAGRHSAAAVAGRDLAADGPDPCPASGLPAGLPAPSEAELTHVARPLVRAAVPESGPDPSARFAALAALATPVRRVAALRPAGLAALAAGVAAVVIAGALAAAVVPGLLADHPASAAAAAPSNPASGPTTRAAAEPSAGTARPTTRAAAGPATAASDSSAAGTNPLLPLAELDRRRSLAYAQRRPQLLGQVYRSPGLLAQDTAQLLRLVPAGCGLTGLHTHYQPVPAATPAMPASGRYVLTVVAQVSAGTLSCSGTAAGRTLPGAPVGLQVELERGSDGLRIIGETAIAVTPH